MALRTLKNHGRTVTFSDKKTSRYLPKASTLGFSKHKASPGDFIRFEMEEGRECFARVLGIIAETDRDGIDGRGMILVAMLGSNLSFSHELWIREDDIRECMNAGRVAAFLGWFMSAPVSELAGYIRQDTETHMRVARLKEAATAAE